MFDSLKELRFWHKIIWENISISISEWEFRLVQIEFYHLSTVISRLGQTNIFDIAGRSLDTKSEVEYYCDRINCKWMSLVCRYVKNFMIHFSSADTNFEMMTIRFGYFFRLYRSFTQNFFSIRTKRLISVKNHAIRFQNSFLN